MVNYLELPVGDHAPEVFRAVIEIPLDGTQKFEYDKQLHVFKLDRNLHSPVHYPGDYGFIPSTLSDDGDPLDVLVLVPNPSFPGCVQEVRPIGLLEMMDQGTLDEKVLAVGKNNPRFAQHLELYGHLSAHAEGDNALLLDLQGSGGQAGGDEGLARCGVCAGSRDARDEAVPGKQGEAGNRDQGTKPPQRVSKLASRQFSQCTAAGEQRDGKPVEQRAEQGNARRKKQRRDVGESGIRIAEFFSARGVERVGDEDGWAHREQTGNCQVAGPEGPLEMRLAQAQHNQRDEFEQQARSVENQVNGDEALEGEIECERPGKTARDEADPGYTAAVAPSQDARQHAILRHGDGQARIAHHERVEHANAADGAAGDNSCSQDGTADCVARDGPRTCRKALWREAGDGHGCEGKNVGDGSEDGGGDHGARDSCAEDFRRRARSWKRCPIPCSSTKRQGLRWRDRPVRLAHRQSGPSARRGAG